MNVTVMLAKGTLVKRNAAKVAALPRCYTPLELEVGRIETFESFVPGGHDNGRATINVKWDSGRFSQMFSGDVRLLTDKETFRYNLGLSIVETVTHEV